MKLDPVSIVECDYCHEEERFSMMALACRSWDERCLDSEIKRAGWFIAGDDVHFCSQECAEAYELEND